MPVALQQTSTCLNTKRYSLSKCAKCPSVLSQIWAYWCCCGSETEAYLISILNWYLCLDSQSWDQSSPIWTSQASRMFCSMLAEGIHCRKFTSDFGHRFTGTMFLGIFMWSAMSETSEYFPHITMWNMATVCCISCSDSWLSFNCQFSQVTSSTATNSTCGKSLYDCTKTELFLGNLLLVQEFWKSAINHEPSAVWFCVTYCIVLL